MTSRNIIIGDFVWDENKEVINVRKHGVTFMEAKTVFDDVNAVYIPDDEHSQEEERFIVLGESQTQKLLVVCYCERKNGKTRIFSARKAEKKEKNYYVGEQL